jgi:hypothetical protein
MSSYDYQPEREGQDHKSKWAWLALVVAVFILWGLVWVSSP